MRLRRPADIAQSGIKGGILEITDHKLLEDRIYMMTRSNRFKGRIEKIQGNLSNVMGSPLLKK